MAIGRDATPRMKRLIPGGPSVLGCLGDVSLS
jgi:hypothetical protein